MGGWGPRVLARRATVGHVPDGVPLCAGDLPQWAVQRAATEPSAAESGPR